ncbi:D-serine ammonia-lyase [Solibacillus sp. MA9]|uniref:Probable D-serine dehydratase n=1 Tax=Solibacillus palustris TaxID=2908203 RepID=A0ABS9UAS4_9BACL|nr:D-serine ammonia-lyase [Solibacillus sp. MA9]MCH7321313.1 D-serine ammonia-lyase [Solibacillus sp. MA9]
MGEQKIDVNALTASFPLIEKLQMQQYVFWINEQLNKEKQTISSISMEMIREAEQKLQRFSSYIKEAFPITKFSNGLIESELKEIPNMKKLIEGRRGFAIPGTLMLKCDHALPIAGSIKARGGIYEVLSHAEKLALDAGLISKTDDYAKFTTDNMRAFFNQYKIAVGSTGNLGLSIGMISARLGFQVTVHMSVEAKQWKKDLLRKNGVEVIEHKTDYTEAVRQGRIAAEKDNTCHFIDDENSVDLFLGYAVAGLRLQEQLKQAKVKVDADHPLFVYLPCGVGGGPGGVAYSLKQIYGKDVHIFFGEPMQSPCMLLGMMTGLHDEISVGDIGLTNQTEADGLAVGRPSRFVGTVMESVISGCYTVDDSFLFRSLKGMFETENIFMEPSAHAGVYGPIELMMQGVTYLEKHNLQQKLDSATHIIWSTGGDLVPEELRQQYLQTEI